MDDQRRSEASADPGEASAQPPSPENERPRLIAVLLPNILVPHQVIRPLVGSNQIIQVAMLSINNGLYNIVRTGALVIDPETAGARHPSLPIPVALLNAGSIAGVATVLPSEMIGVVLPNISPRHYQLLLDFEREESKLLEWRRTIRDLESMVTVLGAPDRQRISGNLLPQALKYERLATIFVRRRQNDAPYNAPALDEHVCSRCAHMRKPVKTRTPPRPMFSSSVETCRRFLASLRSLSLERPVVCARAVRLLIQLLIHDVMTPQQFCARLERLLEVPPQTHVVSFLQENIRQLRQAMYMNLATLEGIERPERRTAFPIPAAAPELPECGPVVDPPGPLLPIAAVVPQQAIPLSAIPYDLPLPLYQLHVCQVVKSGLLARIKIEPREGDLHLYSPHVGYVHFRMTPTASSFQIGDTTVRLVPARPNRYTHR